MPTKNQKIKINYNRTASENNPRWITDSVYRFYTNNYYYYSILLFILCIRVLGNARRLSANR